MIVLVGILGQYLSIFVSEYSPPEIWGPKNILIVLVGMLGPYLSTWVDNCFSDVFFSSLSLTLTHTLYLNFIFIKQFFLCVCVCVCLCGGNGIEHLLQQQK